MKGQWKNVMVITGLLFVLLGCSQDNIDRQTKADIATKARQDVELQGVQYTVKDGIVSLSGTCATSEAKARVATTVGDIAGVKGVINNIVVGPVVIGTDYQLKQSVDSVLKTYPDVLGVTKDSTVTLEGSVRDTIEARNLALGVQRLRPRTMTDRVSVRSY